MGRQNNFVNVLIVAVNIQTTKTLPTVKKTREKSDIKHRVETKA